MAARLRRPCTSTAGPISLQDHYDHVGWGACASTAGPVRLQDHYNYVGWGACASTAGPMRLQSRTRWKATVLSDSRGCLLAPSGGLLAPSGAERCMPRAPQDGTAKLVRMRSGLGWRHVRPAGKPGVPMAAAVVEGRQLWTSQAVPPVDAGVVHKDVEAAVPLHLDT